MTQARGRRGVRILARASWIVAVTTCVASMAVRGAAASRASGFIVDPVDRATVDATFPISGHAFDTQTLHGVDVVHIWAMPADGSPPVFVAGAGCDPAASCNYTVTASGLTRGVGYTLVAYAHLVATDGFEAAATAQITVAPLPDSAVTSIGTTAAGPADDPAVSSEAASVAYDDKHDVFLLAWESGGDVLGRFVGFDGTAKGDAFTLATERVSSALMPIAAYSRGTIDDVFFVMYASDVNGAGKSNVFAQRVRYTGTGASAGTLVGGVIEVSAFSRDATHTQYPADVSFNPDERQFLLTWRDQRDLSARVFAADGTPVVAREPIAMSMPWTCGGFTSFTGGNTAYDWMNRVFLFASVKSEPVGGPRPCPSGARTSYQFLVPATLTETGAGVLYSGTSFIAWEGVRAAVAPDANGLALAWDRSPIPGGTGNGSAWTVPTWDAWTRTASLSSPSGDLAAVIGSPGDDTGVHLEYDADAARILVVARRRAANDRSWPATATDGITLAVLDAAGRPLTGRVNLPGTPPLSVPDLTAARDGVFALAYTTPGGAVLHRVAVAPGPPASVRFSNVTAGIDAVPAATGSAFTISGYAIDFGASAGTGVDAVQAIATPQGGGTPIPLGTTSSFVARPDVVALVGDRFTDTGFSIRANGLPAGTYDIAVQAHSTVTGTFVTADTITVTVSSTPLLAVDGPGASVPPVFDVGGWAVDLGAADGEVGMDAIHVYAVDGGGATFLGATAVSRPRPDVAAVLGAQFADSGYRLTSPPLPLGAYTLVVYAHSTVADAWISQARAITVRAPRDPVLNVDTPLDGATVGAHVVVAGWAADLDALQTKGVGVDAVHIWAIDANGTGTFLGATAPGSARPDVANAFGPQFRDSGFAVTVTAPPPGAYTLVVYAHSAVSGQWSGQTRAITVRPPGLPAMNVDTPAEGATATQPFILAGWAVDLDAASGPGVDVLHVWAIDPTTGNGTFVGATTTGGQRDDVGAAFGSQFATAGFNLSVFGLAPGTYQLIVYAHSTVTDTFSQARVVAVTIQ